MKNQCVAIFGLITLVAASAGAADVPVRYTVDDKALKAAVSGTMLTFSLYSDSACTAQMFSQVVAIDNVGAIEKLKRVKPKGGTKPPSTDELEAALSGAPAAAVYYLKVTGTGVTAVGGACQVQAGVGGARAYATLQDIGSFPGFDPARTLNFTAVSHAATGVYCLTPAAGIDPSTGTASVSVEWGYSSGSDLAAFYQHGNFVCAAGQYEVRTYDFSGTVSDDVAFTIVVP